MSKKPESTDPQPTPPDDQTPAPPAPEKKRPKLGLDIDELEIFERKISP